MLWNLENRRRVKFGGYWCLYIPEHPKSNPVGFVGEHKVLMENKIERKLADDEIVHHKDGDLNNNQINNLQLMTNGEHVRYHNYCRGRKMVILKCPECQKIFEKRLNQTLIDKINNKMIGRFCCRTCSYSFFGRRKEEKKKRYEGQIIKIYKFIPVAKLGQGARLIC